MEILLQKFASSCGRQHQLQRGLRELWMYSQHERQQPQPCFTQYGYWRRFGVGSHTVFKRRWVERTGGPRTRWECSVSQGLWVATLLACRLKEESAASSSDGKYDPLLAVPAGAEGFGLALRSCANFCYFRHEKVAPEASRVRCLFVLGAMTQRFRSDARMYFWVKLNKWLLRVYIVEIGVRGDICELKFYKNEIRWP